MLFFILKAVRIQLTHTLRYRYGKVGDEAIGSMDSLMDFQFLTCFEDQEDLLMKLIRLM